MKKKQLEAILYSAAGIVAMFVLIVGFNIVTGVIKTRIDLTQERAYTLSEGTKAILRKLDTPVKIRFYSTQVENATPETVFLRNYAQQVEDLLDELKQRAGGKLIIEKYNPQPDSDAEDSARLDGIEGQGLPPYGENYYLGLSISMLDEKAAIPFLSPTGEKLLEYDIIRKVSQVITPEKPVVGVMSALPVFGMPMNPMMMRMGQQGQDPWVFVSELKQDFTVKEVSMAVDKIDDDIKVLVVIYPKEISETAQYAIDQFVLRGGKLVAFVDPLSIADNRTPGMNPLQQATSSGATMDKLLKAWGVEFDMAKVVSDMTFKTRINRGGPQGEEAPSVLSLNKEAIGADDVLTSQLDNLLFAYSGVFTGTPKEGLKQTVLLKTTQNSDLTDKIMAQYGGAKEFKPSGKEYPLAIRLTGKFKTAFPEGKPGTPAEEKKDGDEKKEGEEKKEASKTGASLKESTTDGVVILAGDSDWVYDPVCVQVQNIFGQKIIMRQNGNLDLAQSMVEQLAGDSNLIAVRSRATLNRPFTVVKKMEEKAQGEYRNKIKELETKLSETQQKLNQLQATKDKDQRFILSPEQQQELAKFRQTEAQAKKELKAVRKNLRQDIDSLENWLKVVNIAGMPVAVIVCGVALAMNRRKKTAAK
jgi:gliding motility-associatede transport system auxiliary component